MHLHGSLTAEFTFTLVFLVQLLFTASFNCLLITSGGIRLVFLFSVYFTTFDLHLCLGFLLTCGRMLGNLSGSGQQFGRDRQTLISC